MKSRWTPQCCWLTCLTSRSPETHSLCLAVRTDPASRSRDAIQRPAALALAGEAQLELLCRFISDPPFSLKQPPEPPPSHNRIGRLLPLSSLLQYCIFIVVICICFAIKMRSVKYKVSFKLTVCHFWTWGKNTSSRRIRKSQVPALFGAK